MKICSKCGEKFESGKFCKYCGGTLVDEAEESQELHCSKCGAVLAEDFNFCPKCGLETNEYKSKIMLIRKFLAIIKMRLSG